MASSSAHATGQLVSVYLGRFCPFHLGHAHVLSEALASSKLVIVLVGSSHQSRSIKNPFTFGERRAMIMAWAGKRNVMVLPLLDYPYNNTAWIAEVQDQVSRYILKDDTVQLIGSDRDETTWYLRAFPQWELSLVEPFNRPDSSGGPGLTATSLRHQLFIGPMAGGTLAALKTKVPETTLKFLAEFDKTAACTDLRAEYSMLQKYKKSWAAAPYAPTFSTADAAVIQSGHVLIVQRGAHPGKGLWALPGGFVNQNESIQDCAIRELIEETGISLADGKRSRGLTENILRGSIIAKEIFDDPARSARGRTITVAYLFRLDDTKPLPKVKGQFAPLSETGGAQVIETAHAFWLPIGEALASPEKWFEDHHGILKIMGSLKK